jgi:phage shock protein E
MSFFSKLFGMSSSNNQRIQAADYKVRFVDGKQPHTLVDVRTRDEFNGGHIPGAINISVQELSNKFNKIPQSKPVVVYCRSGSRSSQAARILTGAGYTEVLDLGSVMDWSRLGMPLKK